MKTPRTNMRIRGFIPRPVMQVLRHEFGEAFTVLDADKESSLRSVFDTEEYKSFKKSVTPSDYVRTYRENAGLTQTALAEKLNLTRAYVCDMEHGRRIPSKNVAKQLADFFNIPVERFI
ncbi:MAG: helix-turn-helix transcriptional regulator [Fibrobacteres bacterium]|nr:helix-turn-helix transcriptional regulator [Fibrobacterota bacterium]